MFNKTVMVTRKTRLEELIERFNTRSQAKFYIEHAGGDFADYEKEDDAYRRALEAVHNSLDFGIPQLRIDRSLVYKGPRLYLSKPRCHFLRGVVPCSSIGRSYAQNDS